MEQERVVDTALPYIKKFEGFSSKPYLDQVHVPTIGYGSTRYRDGTRVTMSDAPISEAEATSLMVDKIKSEFLPGLTAAVGSVAGLNTNQAAAVLSLMYNMGVNAIANSTLVRNLKAGDFKAAADQFLVWNHAGGVVNAGLTNRRKQEQALFLTPL